MLEFDAKTHTYTLDGRQIPSVSEIIRFAHREVYEDPNQALMDIAADRGTRVHRACQELDESGTTEADEDIAGYVNAYIKFRKEHQCIWKGIEEMIYADVAGGEFAGTLDRYGLLDGVETIVDIKTSSKITKKHQLLYATQMSAYMLALMCKPTKLVQSLAILHLKNDGTYKLIYVDKKVEEFYACLLLHNAFSATKRKKKGDHTHG